MHKYSIEHWEDLIDAVDKSSIPFEFINRIILNFQDTNLNKTVEVWAFREEGHGQTYVEDVIDQILRETDSKIISMDFIVDVQSVASTAQHETDILLKKIP